MKIEVRNEIHPPDQVRSNDGYVYPESQRDDVPPIPAADAILSGQGNLHPHEITPNELVPVFPSVNAAAVREGVVDWNALRMASSKGFKELSPLIIRMNSTEVTQVIRNTIDVMAEGVISKIIDRSDGVVDRDRGPLEATVLHRAVAAGREPIVRELLDEVNQSVRRELLEARYAKPGGEGEGGMTALSMALKWGFLGIAKVLVWNGEMVCPAWETDAPLRREIGEGWAAIARAEAASGKTKKKEQKAEIRDSRTMSVRRGHAGAFLRRVRSTNDVTTNFVVRS